MTTAEEARNAALLERLKKRPSASPAAALLGAEPLAIDAARGFARLAFQARPEFCNPMGILQGGFITGMLDEAMAIAAVATRDFTDFVPTLELKISFFRPVPPGRLVAEGAVTHLGRRIVFTEARLFDPDGRLCAAATGTAQFRSGRLTPEERGG